LIEKIENSIPGHYLYPAYIFADRKPHLVTTVLGSCVSVCFYDPVMKIGGLNHFMLPLWNGEGLASPKYGNIAIEKLLDKLFSLGVGKNNLIAKVFGGADSLEQKQNFYRIGARNIILAMDILEEKKIKVISQSTGGNTGRNIKFHTGTGEVLLRYIKKSPVIVSQKNLPVNGKKVIDLKTENKR